MKIKCDNCGDVINRAPSQIAPNKHHFCSKKCKYLGLRKKREVRAGEIQVSQGQWYKVDEQDYEWLSQYAWYDRNGYPNTHSPHGRLSMHRLIFERTTGKKIRRGYYVDHRDRDLTNNRRSNLRLATHRQNIANQGPNKANTTGYKGVSKNKKGKWESYIRVYRKRVHIGVTTDPFEAAYLYDQFALQLLGEFAYTNFEY